MEDNLPVAVQIALVVWAILGPFAGALISAYIPEVKENRLRRELDNQPANWEIRVDSDASRDHYSGVLHGQGHKARVVVRKVKQRGARTKVLESLLVAEIPVSDAKFDEKLEDATLKAQSLMSTILTTGAM